MITIRVAIEEDVRDKKTKLITTMGTEETFVLPDKFNIADKLTRIREVLDFLEKMVPQHSNENAVLGVPLSAFERGREENDNHQR